MPRRPGAEECGGVSARFWGRGAEGAGEAAKGLREGEAFVGHPSRGRRERKWACASLVICSAGSET